MAPRTKYDLDTFRILVLQGKNKAEIMEEMSIKSYPTFNNIMYKLMVADKKYYSIKEKKKDKAKSVPKVSIGKRNTLTLSAKVLEKSAFEPGDSFQVKFAKNKITLLYVDK